MEGKRARLILFLAFGIIVLPAAYLSYKLEMKQASEIELVILLILLGLLVVGFYLIAKARKGNKFPFDDIKRG